MILYLNRFALIRYVNLNVLAMRNAKDDENANFSNRFKTIALIVFRSCSVIGIVRTEDSVGLMSLP